MLSPQQMQIDQYELLHPSPHNKIRRTYKSNTQIGLMVWNITLASFYFGYGLVYLGTIPVETLMKVYHIDFDKGVTQGILNGCVPIGALCGALMSSIVISKFSRKNCFLFINCIAYIVGGLLFIPNVYTLMIFRVIQGMCVGIFSALAPLVVKQISPIQISGTLGTIVQLNISFGVLFAYVLNYSLKKIMDDLTCQSFWQIMFSIPFITLTIQTLMLVFVYPYQTPKYLLLEGKQEEAKKLIEIIYKPQFVEQVFQEKKTDIESNIKIQNSIISSSVISQNSVDEKIQLTKNTRMRSTKFTLFMGLHLSVMQQMSGVNAINLYCNPIVDKAVTGEIALLMSSLITLEKLLTSFGTSYILIKFGRKSILQIGGLCQGLACLVISIGFFIHQQQPQISDKLIIFGLFFFMAVFGLSLGPVTWLYNAQIVEPNMIPFTTAANWLTSSAVVIFFPIITDNVLQGNPALLFLFFACWQFVAFVFNKFFLLQTKGKTEKQIREQYLGLKDY